MFIKKLSLSGDVGQHNVSLQKILKECDWPEGNQIGLSYREDATDQWLDAVGSLYDKQNKNFLGRESEFVKWNQHVDDYLKNQLIQLQQNQNINLGRIRFMRLRPKTGLSVHKDTEVRYHFVLTTNSACYISNVKSELCTNSAIPAAGKIYHLPCDGYWYLVDTREHHFVYNGGATDRIHLVVCPR